MDTSRNEKLVSRFDVNNDLQAPGAEQTTA